MRPAAVSLAVQHISIQAKITGRPLTYYPSMSGIHNPSEAGPSTPRPYPVPASQPQLLRAHQRDTTQILRLSHLVTELLRSLAGSRWLLSKQHWVDLVVRTAYLLLLFGRGQRTLGEEYTDILPVRAGSGRLSRRVSSRPKLSPAKSD